MRERRVCSYEAVGVPTCGIQARLCDGRKVEGLAGEHLLFLRDPHRDDRNEQIQLQAGRCCVIDRCSPRRHRQQYPGRDPGRTGGGSLTEMLSSSQRNESCLEIF